MSSKHSLSVAERARAEALREELETDGVRFAIAGYADLHGNLKGKMVPIGHFADMAGGSELFTGAALDGLPQDISDEELSARPDLARGVVLPHRPDVALFLSDLYVGGVPFEAAARNILDITADDYAHVARAAHKIAAAAMKAAIASSHFCWRE